MNPEDNPVTPQVGAPTAVPTDAEWQNLALQLHNDHKKEELANPPAAPKPPESSKISQFLDYLKQSSANQPFDEAAQAAGRGVLHAGTEALKTAKDLDEATTLGNGPGVLGKSAAFIDKWLSSATNGATDKFTDAEMEGALGKSQPGVLGFIEDASQFTTGLLAAGEVLKPLSLAVKTKNALSMAGASATVFDPYKSTKGLGDLIKKAPPEISSPLTSLLVADPEKDGPLTARLKAATVGIMTDYAVEKLVAGVKVLRALTKAGGDAAAPEVKSALAEQASVKHDPATQGPAIVHQTEDGQFAVVDNTPSVAAPDRRAVPREGSVDRRATPRPDYTSMTHEQQHESWFNLTNEALAKSRTALSAIGRNEAPAITAAREGYIERLMAEADHVKSLMAAKTGPTFATAAEAEGTAASINEAVLNKRDPLSIHLLSTDQIQHLRDTGNTYLEGAGWPKYDYNFDYNASPEQVQKTVQSIAKYLPEPIGVQTHAQTVALAEELFDGKSGDDVVKMLRDKNIATKDMPQYINGAREFMNSTGQRIAALSKAADAQPDNAVAYNSLNEALNHLADVHESAAGLISTSGRALDANKIIVGETADQTAARATGEAAGAATAKSEISNMDKPDLMALARQIRMADGDPNAILQLMRAQAKVRKETVPGVMDNLNSIRAEAMLSGPKTQITNAVSNAISAVQLPVERWWGGVISGNTAMRQQGSDELAGVILQLKDAWTAGARSFKTGTNSLDELGGLVRDVGVDTSNPINGLVRFGQLPSRLLMSSDEFFKQLSYRASVRAQSLRLAREDGITSPIDLAQRVADDMKAAFTESGSATNPKALDYARIATFQNPLEYGVGKSVQEFVQDHPAARLIMPFVRTPVNLFRYAWQRTPILNLIQKDIQGDLAAGGERQALAIAKTQMGMVTYSGAAALAYSKLITGGGPTDPELKRQWLAAGNQPYSMRVPGGWVSYARLNPAFTAMGIVADVVQASGEQHHGSSLEIAAAFAAAVSKNVTNKTFMQGVSGFLDAASNGSGKTMMEEWKSTAGSFLPNITNQLNPDDVLSEVRGMMDEMKSRIPGLSTTLEPRRNILGEPVMKAPGYINQAFNPFTYLGDKSNDKIQQQLVDLGKGMAMPPATPDALKGQPPLTDRDAYDNGTRQSPYDRMLQLQSIAKDGMPSLRDKLKETMNSQMWKDAGSGNELYPGGKRYIIAAKIISEYQQKAYHTVQDEYPKLKEAIQGGKIDKHNAIQNPSRPQFLTP